MTTIEQEVEFDEIAVQRAIEGDVNVRLSREDLREAYRRLREEELSDGEVGDTLGVDRRTVVRWNAAGGPTTGRLGDPQASKRWPPQNDSPKSVAASGSIEQLLATAEASPSGVVRRAFDKARVAIDNLRAAVEADHEKAAVRAEVERLQAELAVAKAKLRGNQLVRKPRGATKVRQPVGVP